MIGATQKQFPGFRFSLTRKVDSVNNSVRFAWELGPQDGPALVEGTDFGTIASDGRIETITGFLDRIPASAGA